MAALLVTTEVMVAELPKKSSRIRRAAVWAVWAAWIIEVCPTENLGPGLCAGAFHDVREHVADFLERDLLGHAGIVRGNGNRANLVRAPHTYGPTPVMVISCNPQPRRPVTNAAAFLENAYAFLAQRLLAAAVGVEELNTKQRDHRARLRP